VRQKTSWQLSYSDGCALEDLAILIDRPPRGGPFALGREKHLIQVPCVTGPRALATQVMRIGLSTLPAPRADGFISYEDTTHEQQLFDIAIPEAGVIVQQTP
jgi:hypothetical protein